MASNKLTRARTAPADAMKMDMSPMIDMVFLLLIFFLVNATLIVVKMDKNVVIPIAGKAEPQKEANGRIVINVYGDEHAAKGGRFRAEDGVVFTEDQAMEQYIAEKLSLIHI